MNVREAIGFVGDVIHLAVIAVILLVPEFLRLVACKVTRRQYRPPTHRILEEVDE